MDSPGLCSLALSPQNLVVAMEHTVGLQGSGHFQLSSPGGVVSKTIEDHRVTKFNSAAQHVLEWVSH